LFHKLYIVLLEVTSKALAYVLTCLLLIEMTRGEDAKPTHTSGSETRVLTWMVSDAFVTRSIYKFNPLYITDKESDDLSDMSDKTLSRS
jgi:hypothetical protein